MKVKARRALPAREKGGNGAGRTFGSAGSRGDRPRGFRSSEEREYRYEEEEEWKKKNKRVDTFIPQMLLSDNLQ